MAYNPNSILDAPLTAASTGIGLGPTGLLAQPYAVSSSISQANQLRLTCSPLSSLSGDTFFEAQAVYTISTDLNGKDQVFIAITGAAAGATYNFKYYPAIQYNPQPGSAPLIDMRVANPGLYTVQFLQSMFSANRHLPLMGPAELSGLCKKLSCANPEYDDLFDAFLQYETQPRNIGTGSAVSKASKNAAV